MALKIWAYQWKDKKIWFKCDNVAVVVVLTSGKIKDATLDACACNIWMLSALFNIFIHIEYVAGKSDVIAYLLSMFKLDQHSWELLSTSVQNASFLLILT